ncbi:MAG: crossover junction endodeoxyribonuclease RuvC [Bacteroidetes bacterium HGW-Bacteroidetes-6]|jgi:crossover junction endodeoxyribonuclease RuvC|nr:MAG: crossover junction endodeoxyribonuclease RuvC [Bacteroidetes bacterium HGW-Bacteroidetes-6]
MANGNLILGIDPGTNIMGYCILRFKNSNYKIISIGSLKLNRLNSHLEKLNGIVEFMQKLLLEHKPDVLAIEEPFFGKNVQSMLKLGRAQGVVMAIAMAQQIPIVEITPRRVKQSVTGSGSASKEQVASMVGVITGLDISLLDADSTDAAAIAISYTLQKNHATTSVKKVKPKNSWEAFLRDNPGKEVK